MPRLAPHAIWPGRHLALCVETHRVIPSRRRQLWGGNRAIAGTDRDRRGKRRLLLARRRNDDMGLPPGPDRRWRGRIPLITSGMAASCETGSNLRVPWYLCCLARAYRQVRQLNKAWRSLDEAMAVMATTKETWLASELHRIAGELARMSPPSTGTGPEEYLGRALAVARERKAKSCELRAATSPSRAGERRSLRAPISPKPST